MSRRALTLQRDAQFARGDQTARLQTVTKLRRLGDTPQLAAETVRITTRLRESDPRWTPWDRFVERVLRDVDALASLVAEPETIMFPGPTTYTTACNCGSTSPGWHRQDCGVFA